MTVIETDCGTLSISYSTTNYHLDEKFRNLEPENLAFLYTLRDLGIMHVSKNFIFLRECMIEYFSNHAFVERMAIDICRDIAKKTRTLFDDVRDNIEYTVGKVWRGYDYHRLRRRYGLGSENDFEDSPKTARLIKLFCELAYVNYRPFMYGR